MVFVSCALELHPSLGAKILDSLEIHSSDLRSETQACQRFLLKNMRDKLVSCDDIKR